MSDHDNLGEAIDELGRAIQGVSVGLQVKMGQTAANIEKVLETSTERLTTALNTASAAADNAATASAKHARNLAWATWALVAVTIVLAAAPAIEHLFPGQTARQRECTEVGAYIAAQSSEPVKGSDGSGPWNDYRKDPIVGAPQTAWANNAAAVAAYFRCLHQR